MARVIALSLCLGSAGLQPAAAGQPGYRVGGQVQEVVVRVNGEPVTRAEVERLMTGLASTEADAGAREQRAVRELIHHRLLLQEGARRELRVAETELDAALASLRRRFGELGEFGAWMQSQGFDERALMQALRETMLASRVRAALVADLQITDSEIERYYAEHREAMKTTDVWIQVIVVRERAAAAGIQAALDKGEDFGQLARERSLGLRAAQGGDVGWVGLEDLWQPLRRAVSTLQPGEAIGPLPRGEDFLIVRLHQRRPGGTKSLEQARPVIEPRLLAAKQEETMQSWLAQQEAQARIEVLRPPEQ